MTSVKLYCCLDKIQTVKGQCQPLKIHLKNVIYYDFAKEYIQEALKNVLAFTLKFNSNLLCHGNFKPTI